MTVWDRLGSHLRSLSGGVRRFRVAEMDPLVLVQIDGDERLEEGEEDVSLSDGFRVYRAAHGVPVGAVVLVHETEDEFVVFDVQSDRALSSGGGGAGMLVGSGAPTLDTPGGSYLDGDTGDLYAR